MSGVDVVYTDVWASMGMEAEAEARKAIFRPYQVNAALMAKAKEDAIFMHCLPAHRGDEVTDEVIESWQSVVFDEAENRLHAQKAVILRLMVGRRRAGLDRATQSEPATRSWGGSKGPPPLCVILSLARVLIVTAPSGG